MKQVHTVLGDLHDEVDKLKSELAGRDSRIQELQDQIVLLKQEIRTEYSRVVERARRMLAEVVPRGATVAVISKGDSALIELADVHAWHFPQHWDGTYTGYHPADSTSAIVQLESVRARGAEYLLIPRTASWWLDHYRGFRRHLESRYRLCASQDDAGMVFDLREVVREVRGWIAEIDAVIRDFELRYNRAPTILDWSAVPETAAQFPTQMIFRPPTRESVLPYLDKSVDLVAFSGDDPAVAMEGERVASAATIRIDPSAIGTDASSVRVRWMDDHRVAESPTTSIVIPTYNGIEYVEALLRTLQETLPSSFDVEIIVVDDASTDDTQARLAAASALEPRLRVVKNKRNLGFILSCNAGARSATGEVLVFLNNDTLALPGWLPPIWRILREHPDAGAVGGKLVYPDGRMQDAGGVVFSDGSAANFGRMDPRLEAPLYNYVREVDYVTGAFIATRRELFLELGGFDTHYKPAYYEETDYCFRLREHGFRVFYQPESVIIHLEGATCGTDITQGVKRYQVVNKAKFAKRWRKALTSQPPRPSRFDLGVWHGLAARSQPTESSPS